MVDNQEENEEFTQSDFDKLMMGAALDLARRGAGNVSPNPMVGAVIVDSDRRVIAEGWHEQYGGPHAEINALRAVDGHDLSGATMYVTLEPCSHVGNTPPCADAVVASGIQRVVVGMRDPNPLVSGRGNRRMRESGIQVEVGVLEHEVKQLNEAYIHFITTGLPFVTIKMAQTLDGLTAVPSGESRWITGESSRRRVHQMRAVNDAVMVGTRTAIMDNPSLTLRYGVEGRNPRRVILDRQLAIPAGHNIVSDEHRELTILFTADSVADGHRANDLRSTGVIVYGVPITGRGLKLTEVFRILAENKIASILVEGGSGLAGALIKEGLTQKLVLFVAPKLFGEGYHAFTGLGVEHLADAFNLTFSQFEPVGEDLMIEAYWTKSG